jgi:hypothetical protein
VASNTQKTEKQRQAKARDFGKAAKKVRERDGTTRSEAELFGNVLPRKPQTSAS